MIELSDVRKSYRMGKVRVDALRGVSLSIAHGDFVAIVGPSGSGKSTLMHIVGLLDTPDHGSYRLDGREVRGLSEDEMAAVRARRIGFVFQQFNLLPRVSARANVGLPLIYGGSDNAADPSALLEKVGLAARAGHAPNELSGGEQQRVAIARALVNSPSIVMADEPTGNLDSTSSAEIMRILRDLHAGGMTVILVTHDAEVARSADRVITFKDGMIVGDERHAGSSGAAGGADRRAGGTPARRRWSFRRQTAALSAMLGQAGRSLAANKTRTLLSMLGVLIGVAAVIAVMSIGRGAKIAVEERISSMGANLLILMPQRYRSGGVSLGAGAVSRLTVDDALAVEAEVDGVAHACPTVRGNAQVTFENRNWRTSVTGVAPSYEEIHSMTPAAGRFVSDADIASRSRVAVIGTTVASELFGDTDPIGKTIRINRIAFDVIGLLPDKGTNPFSDENDRIVVPISTAMRRLLGRDYIDMIEIQASSGKSLDYVQLASRELMKRRHPATKNNDDAFQVRSMVEIQDMITSTSRTMSVLLLGIGAISLLVGGIGIMNIMLVSVTERTREIGIRKAVGARRRDILAQFLVESVFVSVCGGMLGLALGIGASLAASRIAGWTVAVTSGTVLVAFAFSVAVGVVFGLWPARKASLLQPIEALRYE
ncbi:MAG: ATP-binding cassette domain-containing protein [Lentisphaerae bacterium]|nr:ATP-binding cassette domain-containing protein [Lentisphaerota bacterium]